MPFPTQSVTWLTAPNYEYSAIGKCVQGCDEDRGLIIQPSEYVGRALLVRSQEIIDSGVRGNVCALEAEAPFYTAMRLWSQMSEQGCSFKKRPRLIVAS
jgi:hypothetical protein